MKKILLAGFLLLSGASIVTATTPTDASVSWQKTVSAFRQIKTVTAPVSPVPQVIEVSFDSDTAERFSFAVMNTASREFVGNLFVDQSSSSNIPLVVGASNGLNPEKMIDTNMQTYAEYALPVDIEGQGLVDITVSGTQPFTLSSLALVLDNHVALPTSISISALVNGVPQTVLAPVPMKHSSVVFPKTTSARWTITLVYSQPLRITELVLPQESGIHVQDRYLRFLAQSGVTYEIYFDPDRNVSINTPESANLRDDQGIYRVSASAITNTLFVLADVDSDGVIDVLDNCTSVANADQVDIDGNGRGDVCDDFDKDGVQNNLDNCLEIPNRDQDDTDGDKVGDACDGEESRFTERYAWFPWVGIGFAGIVLAVLFISVLGMSKDKKPEETPQV